jgi:NAD(P)-dependent dehydrogenase (short-subunit alcohol dehydrogenase family)
MGNGNLPAYVASKHGVVGLSKSVSACCWHHPKRTCSQVLINQCFPPGRGSIRPARHQSQCCLPRVSQVVFFWYDPSDPDTTCVQAQLRRPSWEPSHRARSVSGEQWNVPERLPWAGLAGRKRLLNASSSLPAAEAVLSLAQRSQYTEAYATREGIKGHSSIRRKSE